MSKKERVARAEADLVEARATERKKHAAWNKASAVRSKFVAWSMAVVDVNEARTALGKVLALPDDPVDVTIHDSPQYERASQVRLNEWAESRLAAVRAAALTELAMRKLTA